MRKVKRMGLRGYLMVGGALLAVGFAVPAFAEEADAAEGAAKEAKDIYTQRCTTCHGESGKGDGAAAVALNPKPRDLGLAEWQESVDDAHIEKVIVSGGPAVGKSPLMPPNPDLAAKTEVVQELRKIVRAFGAK